MTVTKLTAAVAVIALLSCPALAQTQDAVPEAPTDHSQMDHAKMDHSNMDHSAHDMSEIEATPTAVPIATDASLITAKVNGLVCDFCAQALKKVFKKEESVETLTVDLDAGEVVIVLKSGGDLNDARVKKLIRKSGYSLVSINRSGGA